MGTHTEDEYDPMNVLFGGGAGEEDGEGGGADISNIEGGGSGRSSENSYGGLIIENGALWIDDDGTGDDGTGVQTPPRKEQVQDGRIMTMCSPVPKRVPVLNFQGSIGQGVRQIQGKSEGERE